MNNDRRRFLKVLGGATAASIASVPVMEALADPPSGQNEFFVFIHASGAWDITLSLDPRNERRGLIEPASSDNILTDSMRRWVNRPLDGDSQTFDLVRPSGSSLVFGPAIGELGDMADRLCVINGLAVNTVSHPDGAVFGATGRHLAGGRAAASSVDTVLANEFGREQLFPVVSVQFPSSFVADQNLDRRVTPLRMASIDTVSRTLARSNLYETAADRDAVTAMLSTECAELAARQARPEVLQGFGLQFDGLRRMLSSNLQAVFSSGALQSARPEFNYRGRYQGKNAVNAAFAVEAMRRNVVRSVSFALGGLDTHNSNYQYQGANQQEVFDLIATLVRALDMTPHPTLTTSRLSEHTHILVVSEFCRTPQINAANGRDHYPNGSAVVISPRFKGNFTYGRSDPEQLLPLDAGMFSDGTRAIAPPDVLATFVSAFGVDPRRYMRDGDVVRALLRP